jgi:hypothetical protein
LENNNRKVRREEEVGGGRDKNKEGKTNTE